MKYIQIIALALLIVSCGSIHVNYDYEKGTNFENYKTYNYFSDMETGLSELDTKRLFNALDAKMKEKGLELSETPDFFIDIKSSEYQDVQNNNTVGIGVGGGGRNMGGGISIGLPIGQSNLSRQITIDFVDEKNKKGLFWQAVSQSSFNPKAKPEKREALFNSIAEKIVKQYPPKE